MAFVMNSNCGYDQVARGEGSHKLTDKTLCQSFQIWLHVGNPKGNFTESSAVQVVPR